MKTLIFIKDIVLNIFQKEIDQTTFYNSFLLQKFDRKKII